MLNKRFFRFLLGFIGMILLGLLGLFIINTLFGGSDTGTDASPLDNLQQTTDNQ